MAATRTVHMIGGMAAAGVPIGAPIRIGVTDRQAVFINMVAMHVVQVAIMEIINVTVVFYGGMAAVRAVFVRMVLMFFAFLHGCFPCSQISIR